ncbi:Zinc finger CCHC domain-containing protein 7 [Oryzias melastigma]|uniref:Zinc finger CCHC domain-containing protein 7 n=1 Tax=Oryzias melastigma TaxID=30732 RepID=A0A834F6L8_ORYME|nr:Zinc finger CCHC domain-containing protein 7 [Oryzias melastigma]
MPLLAFSITSRKSQQNTEQASRADLEEREEDSDFSVEEWMILEGEDQVEDSSIQLNLRSWTQEACRGVTDESVTSQNDTWAVSDKDKYGSDQSLVSRYFFPGRSSFCHRCFKTGHAAKSCFLDKKSPTCVLCGTQGHIQKNCPGRPCPDCGLPSHGVRPCGIPPVWNQHCRRCGMRGHLSFTCPDTWRQYHHTVKPGAPLRSKSVFRKSRAHCYNCSKRGHYGYECVRIRMVRGTFPTLPYVSHYDSLEDVLQHQTRRQMGAKGDNILTENGSNNLRHLTSMSGLPSPGQEHSETSDEKNENESLFQGRNKTKQGTSGRRKTWPERRRERRQVKKLRRKAQAVREGGLPGRSCFDCEDGSGLADLSKKALPNNRRVHTPF